MIGKGGDDGEEEEVNPGSIAGSTGAEQKKKS
jgi:hypothetical protein